MSSTPNPFRDYGIQGYLSLGSIYLLGVGIMTNAIHYKILGVNILHFTSVINVLVTPIAFIVKRPIIIVLLGVLPFLFDGCNDGSKRNKRSNGQEEMIPRMMPPDERN